MGARRRVSAGRTILEGILYREFLRTGDNPTIEPYGLFLPRGNPYADGSTDWVETRKMLYIVFGSPGRIRQNLTQVKRASG